MPKRDLSETLVKISTDLDADVILYSGEINDEGATDLCKQVRDRARKNIILILATYGGDPDAAYRMARRIQKVYGTRNRYKTDSDALFYVYLPTTCKSAGTLLALGADRIVISRDAEVGPIDIQLRKHDEVGERASGLLPGEALSALTGRARSTFLQQFRALRTDRALPFSTKLAADVASKMTVGLFTPIFEQLDPMRLAEMERSQRIASEYGKRLDVGNLKSGSLVRLLGSYPSHDFIIDSDEMTEIFNNVEEANDDFESMSEAIEGIYQNFIDREHPFVIKLTPGMFSKQEESDEDQNAADAGRPDGAGEGDASGGSDGPAGGDRAPPAAGPLTYPEAHNDAKDEGEPGRDGGAAAISAA